VLQCAAVILVVLKQSSFDVWGSSFIPSLPPDYGVQSRGIFVCAFESEKPANVFQAIRVSWEIKVRMDNRQHIRRAFQNRVDFRMEAFGQSRFHAPQGDVFVVPEMQDTEITQLAHGFGELGEIFRLL
jgi:hypothetical protein